MSEEWCCEKLASLKIKENRLSALTEIRIRLNDTVEAAVTNRLLNSPELNECLEEQFDIACDIISICMTNLSISENGLPILKRALEHKRPRIRALALNTILKELRRESTSEPLQDVSDDLLTLILNALEHDETEVSEPAVKILSIILEEQLERTVVKERLQRMLSCNDTVKCRVFALAVNLAKRSPSMLQKVEFLLDVALLELNTDDILLQVNIMEILVLLAEQNHSLVYLEKRQVFEGINKRVVELPENPLDQLLVPGIMRFFGKVACWQPQKIIVGHPEMIQCLFECIRSGDPSILPAAFDTMANLSYSQQGKILMDKYYSNDMKEIFDSYASHLRNLSIDLKNRAFNSLEIMFTAEGTVSMEVSDILSKWFALLADSNNMQFLMDFCRNPFPDIKVACLRFITAVCRYPWGILALKKTGGFLEYLQDRKIEFDKEAKYAKYELIQLLSESSVFDVQIKLQLRKYINEGPYFVNSSMDVAVEGN